MEISTRGRRYAALAAVLLAPAAAIAASPQYAANPGASPRILGAAGPASAAASSVANAGPDQSITLPVARANLIGTVTAPRAEWFQVGGPGRVVFDNSAAAVTGVSFPISGRYPLSLRGRDAAGKILGSDQVVVTVLKAPGTSAAVWKPLAIGAGGFITGIDLNGNGVDRVIRTDTYGGYIWKLNRWRQLVTATSMPAADRVPTGGGVVDVAFAPSNVQRLYLYFNDRLYRSDDKAVTWTRSAGFGTSAAGANDNYRTGSFKVAVDPVNPDIVYVGTRDDGLRRSLDGGLTWTTIAAIPVGLHSYAGNGAVTDTGGGISVFFDPAGGNSGGATRTVYASSWKNGIWRSADAGGSWTRIAGTGASPLHAWRSDIASDGTLYVVDGANGTGKLWRWRNAAWADISPPGALQSVAVDPTNANRIYGFSGGGDPWRSIDAGANWTRLATPSIRTATGDIPWLAWTEESFMSAAQVRFDPVVPGQLWFAQGIGVWKAQVSDTTTTIAWQAESRGIEQLVINDIIAPTGGKPVTAAWDRATFYNASLTSFPGTHGPTARFNSAWQLDWSASTPSFIVANTSDHRFCCGWDGLNIQAGWSDDGGKTWTRFAAQPTPPGSDPNNDYRFAFGDIAVAANDVNNIVWVPTWDGAPAYTKDRGASWSFFNLPNRAANENNGWHGNFYLNRKILAADRVSPNTFYLVNTSTGPNYSLGASAGTWRTTDGGSNWTQMSTGFITDYPVYNAKLKSVPGKAGHLFFTPGSLSGDPFIALKRSIDGGAHWQSVPGANRVAAMGFGKPRVVGGYPTIFIAGTVNDQFGIWRSTDEGANWTSMGLPLNSLDRVNTVEGDKSVFGRVYIGFDGSGAAFGDMK